MATFDVAKLLNKITQDIPGINTVLKALAKWDVSALSDVPDGAMQATTDANNNLTIKKKVSGSYTPVAKLMHDVDKLDGYHASTSATANTVAVRNAQGALPGNVLGNAETANTATALASGSVLPVNQGGTGGTTASAARNNLGVAGGSDFTAHVLTAASPSVSGHVSMPVLAADGTSSPAPDGYGLGVGGILITDWDTTFKPGWYGSAPGANGAPLATSVARGTTFPGINSGNGYQWVIAGESNDMSRIFTRKFTNRVPSAVWRELPNGITDDINTSSSTVAASATAVKSVNASAVHVTGNETIAGTKDFTGAIRQKYASITLGTTPSANTHINFDRLDANNDILAQFQTRQDTNGAVYTNIVARNKKPDGTFVSAAVRAWVLLDGTAYAECPTPPANATSNQIATAEWVLSHSNAEQVGDVFASLAATRPGCLLMHGGAVSRATYAILFALIGTTFGEGNGTTTFNLPNLRNKTFWGASSNFSLGTIVPPGLPDVYGNLPLHLSDPNSPAGGAFFVEGSYTSGTSTTGGNAWRDIRFRASRDNAIFGASSLVRPPGIAVNFFIKY